MDEIHFVQRQPAGNDSSTVTPIIVYQRGKALPGLTPTAYKHFRDSIITQTFDSLYTLENNKVDWRPYVAPPKEYVNIYRNNTLLAKLELPAYRRFKDSINNKTKDTLLNINPDRAELHPYIARPVWKPSPYVFTNEKGYVTISLPEVKQHSYRISFFDDNGTELFQIKSLKEPELVLDKVNFIHAGWFSFELFEDDHLKEKNKFFLQKN